MEAKQHATEKQKVNKEIKEEIKNLLTNENGNTTFQMEHSKSRSKRKVYNDSCLPQETRKILNRQSKLALKRSRKRTTNKAQS